MQHFGIGCICRDIDETKDENETLHNTGGQHDADNADRLRCG